jgi:hypothetical protein
MIGARGARLANYRQAANERMLMFGIEWLRLGIPIEKETSVLTDEAKVIVGPLNIK